MQTAIAKQAKNEPANTGDKEIPVVKAKLENKYNRGIINNFKEILFPHRMGSFSSSEYQKGK